ncbi:hypothetical protein WR25_25962 isoform E [Diploscapter pachys]|uniref:Uncharacterized protein n=1 Tax=Diploscapter pachys TaxID=2018661 RepID=A0A2A2KSD1_9BILA|nr:hypothetical protein WR25_25962 isoform C [Diploscapter pachys]PAV76861.1 hypothetical protein WR25_25962 isoform D [Diploscapter pachys]PAV76862.1 hypothetical protein WR25_25962 isoform E [Diploscapter pachys]
MWLFLISLPVYHLIHPSLSVSFPPCESIPSAYCCTPRVRSQCPQLCASISSCAAPYMFLFNRDPSALHSHSHPQEGVASASAASAAVSIAEERGQVFPTLLPPPAIDTEIAAIDSVPALSIIRGVEAPRKNGDGLGLVDGSTGNAKKKEGNAGSQVEKGVIVPPASLALISQGEDEEKEEAEAAEHFFTDELPPKDRGERKVIKVDKGTLEEQSELLDLVDHLIESARENSVMRNRSRKHLEEKNDPEEKEQIPIPTRTTTTIGPWVTRTWAIKCLSLNIALLQNSFSPQQQQQHTICLFRSDNSNSLIRDFTFPFNNSNSTHLIHFSSHSSPCLRKGSRFLALRSDGEGRCR